MLVGKHGCAITSMPLIFTSATGGRQCLKEKWAHSNVSSSYHFMATIETRGVKNNGILAVFVASATRDVHNDPTMTRLRNVAPRGKDRYPNLAQHLVLRLFPLRIQCSSVEQLPHSGQLVLLDVSAASVHVRRRAVLGLVGAVVHVIAANERRLQAAAPLLANEACKAKCL